jgi:hypothetical protein
MLCVRRRPSEIRKRGTSQEVTNGYEPSSGCNCARPGHKGDQHVVDTRKTQRAETEDAAILGCTHPEERDQRIKNRTSRYVTSKELAAYRADPASCPHADFVVCLECGRKFASIATLHLRKHELTSEKY